MGNKELNLSQIAFAQYPGDFVVHSYFQGRSLCTLALAPVGVEPEKVGAVDTQLCIECLLRHVVIQLCDRVLDYLKIGKASIASQVVQPAEQEIVPVKDEGSSDSRGGGEPISDEDLDLLIDKTVRSLEALDLHNDLKPKSKEGEVEDVSRDG